LDEKQSARFALAERLLELAEHSSEIEMRSSLSRIYYAVHHIGIAITGEANHDKIPRLLDKRTGGLGSDYDWLKRLRIGADYKPDFVKQVYGDLNSFKIQFPREMERARSLYERLLQLIGDDGGDGH
jgi:hypothetical protein